MHKEASYIHDEGGLRRSLHVNIRLQNEPISAVLIEDPNCRFPDSLLLLTSGRNEGCLHIHQVEQINDGEDWHRPESDKVESRPPHRHTQRKRDHPAL